MKISYLLLVLSTACSLSVCAQEYSVLIQKADSLYQAADYKKALKFYQEAFVIEKHDAADLYNGACTAALANDTATAFELLRAAIKNGWINIDHMISDNDLLTLHGNNNWNLILQTLRDSIAVVEMNYDRPLMQTLDTIYEADQIIRLHFVEAVNKYGYKHPVVDSLGKLMQYHDSVNTLKVTKILDEKGWVGKEKAGIKGNQALFLVIQHSNLKTQQQYLPMMRDAVKKGNAQAGSLALLEDRVALSEGRKQIYGSQIGTNLKTNQDYILPLDDPDHVDSRRAAVGLEPLSEYVKNWNIIWDIETYKKKLPEIERWHKGLY